MALHSDTHYFCLSTWSDWSHDRDGEEDSGRGGAGCPCSRPCSHPSSLFPSLFSSLFSPLSLFSAPAPLPHASTLLWEAAGRRQSTQPIPGCHLSAPDQSRVRSRGPDQSGASTLPGCPEGRRQGEGAAVVQAPCWVQGWALEEAAVCRLVCPPCFRQCRKRCRWSLPVQIGSYGKWQTCPWGIWPLWGRHVTVGWL